MTPTSPFGSSPTLRQIAGLVLVASFPWALCHQADAGISGENIIVVVNAESQDSLTLANHYVRLREIPPTNIVLLDEVPTGLRVSLDDFREKILKPVLTELNQRGLGAHAQVIAYSAGFPTAVDIREHTKRLTDENQKKYQRPVASINSMTFFYRWVLADSPDYLGWVSNFYARGTFERHFANPFAGEAGERFEAAEDASENAESTEDWSEAAGLWTAIADEYPTLYPVHLRAAEAYANADELDSAVQRLAMATAGGWANRRYVEESESLQKLNSTQGFETILAQLQDVPMKNQGPVPFATNVGWTSTGHSIPSDKGGMPYLLSCVLGVVHERGSTLEQAIEVLERARQADRTSPDGTFGFAKTSDVRVTTREPLYAEALAWLMSRDQNVEIFASKLPTSTKPYSGLMLGAASFDARKRSWSMTPGAIAENLTSLGAAFETGSQTKLTELLHAGAAISSGAVAEPYALVPKFPTPMLHAYYAEGVSAIEAFYLSTTSPYQLLIVGDPACQPFAKAPIDFVRIESGEATDDKIPVNFFWQQLPGNANSTATAAIELHLQGKRIAVARPTNKIEIKLPSSLQGALHCRAVLIGQHPTQPHVAITQTIVLGNPNALPTIEQETVDDEQIQVKLACPDADRIELKHLGRVVAEIEGPSGSVSLTPTQVGRGPIQLDAIGHVGEQAIPGESLLIEF
ncbi:putative transmembrane region and signal peptide protein [Rhodopirellula islandica]|uniref:Transmembrane region and signal peptide protein n=1 Tax=Rhodopirellula islandica TaxID=595434 RepID=A0A0J1B2N6_RHOIS|nr:putative transmembrane region and signal peptide protein [Rhodopirellula islandica]